MIVIGVLLALMIAARIVRADRTIRIARMGVFVERQRVAEIPVEEDPDEEGDTVELRRWPDDDG